MKKVVCLLAIFVCSTFTAALAEPSLSQCQEAKTKCKGVNGPRCNRARTACPKAHNMTIPN